MSSRRLKKRSSRRLKKQRHSQVTSIFRLLLGVWIIAVLLFREHLASFFPQATSSFNLSEPEIILNSAEMEAGNVESLKAQQLKQIDQKVLNVSYQGTSIQELANILSSFTETEAEKARSVYTWITSNIAYDVEMSLSNLYFADVRATTVLRERQTICSGYANLYQALAKAMGLDAVIIAGTATGASYVVGDSEINHAWNAVKIDNQWYLLDATWGAGTVEENQFQQRFKSYYFATPPEQLIFSHFPANPVWQLLEQPYTREKFQALPDVSPQLFQQNIDFVSHQNSAIAMSRPTEIILSVPPEVTVTTNLKNNQRSLPDQYNLVQRKGEEVIIQTAFPELGEYELKIFANSHQSETYPHILTYQITANYTDSPFPRTFAHFQENEGYLYTPLTYELPKHTAIEFKLKVKNALDVQVIDLHTKRWTRLTRYNNLFMGRVNIGSSPVVVVAQFAKDSKYLTVLQYR